MSSKVNAFEMWCYRRMLKIKYTDRVTNVEVLKYTDRVTNVEVLNRMQTELKFLKNMARAKTGRAGRVLGC
jgi:hypothetical protein